MRSASFFTVASMMLLLALSACLPRKAPPGTSEFSEKADNYTPVLMALHESVVTLRETTKSMPVRIGRAWLDKPDAKFFRAADIASFRSELKKAAESAEGAKYVFVKCEKRGALFETNDPKQCAYLLDKIKGVEFEFIAIAWNGVQQCATLMELGCSVHQAIRVKGWNDGMQRPALFVEKILVSAEVPSLLLFRPDFDKLEIGYALVIGGGFSTILSSRIAESLEAPDTDFQNLIHLSNYWSEKDRSISLNQTRAQAFYLFSGMVSLGFGIEALSVLKAGQATISLVKLMALVDLASNGSSFIDSGVKFFNLRESIVKLPPGPARNTAHAAIIIADAAPWLQRLSFGQHAIMESAKFLVRWVAFQTVALRMLSKPNALTQPLVDAICKHVEPHIPKVVAYMKSGNQAAAMAEIKQAAESFLK